MKKTSIITIISTLVLFGIIVSSCTPCGTGAIYFKTQAISASTVRITGIDTSGCCDRYINEGFIPDSKEIRYDSVLIKVQNEIEIVLNEMPINYQFGISSAKACSPAEDFDVFKEVNITSDQPYSSVYPAGESLIDMISVSRDARILDSKINNLMINSSNRDSQYYFKFNAAPDSTRVHTITIEYVFTDGRVLKSVINGLKIGN